MKAGYRRHLLNFRRPGGTSRGILTEKETYFIILENQGDIGIGECAIFRGLSYDDCPDYEEKLNWLCKNIERDFNCLFEELEEFPSIRFGLETAFKSLHGKHPFQI